MKAKISNTQYELIEFNHYIDYNEGQLISIVDAIVKSNDIGAIKKEFSDTFIIDASNFSYVFSNYELIECYEEGAGLIHVVCVK